MSEPLTPTATMAVDEAIVQIKEATAAQKCWSCGCLHNSLREIERAFSEKQRPPALHEALSMAWERLTAVQYDCLGCVVCYPALALNALEPEAAVCPTDSVEARAGWPPLPGHYTVLSFHAPTAVCTLTDEGLAQQIISAASSDIAIVGTLQTENLGIERLIFNVLDNPHLRFLILCGPDSRQRIGHLPGQSLMALARAGLDARSRIIGARGKRPVIRNLSLEAVEHFRRTIAVIDLVGTTQFEPIFSAIQDCARRNPGPAEPFLLEQAVKPLSGSVPERMLPDPAGYCVVYVDRRRRRLSLEHYQNDGLLDRVIEGKQAAELYIPAIEQGLVSRLDHAAYLGRELARAEHALRSDTPYVQDAAPAWAHRAPARRRCCRSLGAWIGPRTGA